MPRGHLCEPRDYQQMSWLRRGGEHGAQREADRSGPGELTFEYLPLPPSALLRVSALWPDADRSMPDVALIVDDGSERHELEPLPDPAAPDEPTRWRAAFMVRASVLEGPATSV